MVEQNIAQIAQENCPDEDVVKCCRRCQSVENYIKPKARTCIKCISKANNQKLKEKNYYKTYYENNKNEIIEKQKHYYDEHSEAKIEKVKARKLAMMPSDYVLKPRGRPPNSKSKDIII
jgi:hypothetical protein